MKVISLLFCSLLLGSCVTIIDHPLIMYGTQQKGTEPITTCDRFIMPDLPDLPKLPDLTDETIRDRHLTEDALIQVISEHRNAIKKTKKVLNEAYTEYTFNCKSK